MAETIVELLTDVADAIREKKGSNEPINAQNFANEIKNLPSGGSGWTGHADAEGLRAIGWTEEDIAYYQQYGVNWNEEDDQYHLVSDDNKALYGVLTADNISTYKDRIVYLPKIDTSAKTNMTNMFDRCANMVAIPMIDTSKCSSMGTLFNRCYSLVCIPPLDCSEVTTIAEMFFFCSSLSHLPQLNFPKLVSSSNAFAKCYSLISVYVATGKVSSLNSIYIECTSLRNIDYPIDMGKITNTNAVFNNCFCLEKVRVKNLSVPLSMVHSSKLTKESLLYMIENETATSAITITLESSAYTRLISDAEIQAALAAHSNVSLAK